MTTWKGKTRGGLIGYRIFVALLKFPGLPFAYFLLRFVAAWYFLFAPGSFRVIFSFYRYRIGFSFLTSVLAVYRNYYTFGQVLLDRTAIMAGLGARFTFTFEGEEHLHKLAADNTGALLISAHLGNFEMAGHLLNRVQTHVHVLMLDAEHERIKQYLSQLVNRSFSVIPISLDGSHLFAIRDALSNKHFVCMHGDRFMDGSKTLEVPFLGAPVRLPAGPFYLALTNQVAVVFVYAMKEAKQKYHFYAFQPKIFPATDQPGQRNELLLSIASEYAGFTEQMIRRYPYQWFNYYDFWNT